MQTKTRKNKKIKRENSKDGKKKVVLKNGQNGQGDLTKKSFVAEYTSDNEFGDATKTGRPEINRDLLAKRYLQDDEKHGRIL